MTNYLDKLPVELLSPILEYLPERSDLANVARCSTALNTISTQLLYRRLEIRAQSRHVEKTNPALGSLTALLLQKPELTALVREFRLKPCFLGPETQEENERSKLRGFALSACASEKVKVALANSTSCNDERLELLERVEHEDALLSILLPSLLNLTTLELNTETQPKYVKRMFWRIGKQEHPFDKNPTFSKLQSMTWAYNDNSCRGYLASGIFVIPSLKTLFLHKISSYPSLSGEELLSQMGERRNSTACEHVEMRDCRINGEDLLVLLKAPRQLKTFIYELGWGHFGYTRFDFGSLRYALGFQKEHLTNIWLDTSYEGIEWYDSIESLEPMSNLRDFEALRRIRIASDFVFGVVKTPISNPANPVPWNTADRYTRLLDLLPASIETVQITHCETDLELVCRSVEHLLFNYTASRFPALISVTLEVPMAVIEEKRDRLLSLWDTASGSGLSLILLNSVAAGSLICEGRQPRGWGMDEDIEWTQYASSHLERPQFERVDLQSYVT